MAIWIEEAFCEVVPDGEDGEVKSRVFSESKPHETGHDSKPRLYHALVRDYGRCTGHVRIDRDGQKNIPIGWVFVKRVRYEDSANTYLREVWVTVVEPERRACSECGHKLARWPLDLREVA